MSMQSFFAASMLGFSCIVIASCRPAPVLHEQSHRPDCRLATHAMVELENNNAQAIEITFELMPCYDGAYAERVDVALGNMLINHPESILAAMHKHDFNSVMINGIVTTQPWDLIDKPCRFFTLLKQREIAIGQTTNHPVESRLALASLKAFIPAVAAGCKTMSEESGIPEGLYKNSP